MERGFTLLEGGLGQAAKAIWTFAFDKLKGSADDGHRLLYLDFGGDDAEIVSIFFLPTFIRIYILTPYSNINNELVMKVQYCPLLSKSMY